MDGEPPQIPELKTYVKPQPKEVSPQQDLLEDVVKNSYARLGTWVFHAPGVDISGNGTVLSKDEFNRRVRRIKQRWNNSSINRLLSGKDGTYLDGSVVSENLTRFHNGTSDIPLSAHNLYKDRVLTDALKENPIVDFVYVGPCTDFDMKTQEGKPERNWFGKSKKTTEEIIDLENPHTVPFNEIITGEGLPNTNEPAVLFAYQFTSNFLTELQHLDREFDRGFVYRDPANRGGNSFIVVAVLPESIGKRMQETIRQDPLFARKVAMGLADEKFDLSTSGYRKPNYEEMRGKGLKMYVALDLDKPLSHRRHQPHTFDSKNVVDIDSLTSKTA